MRYLFTLLCLLCSGCTVFGVAVGAHGSDPSRGMLLWYEVNAECDPTFDFVGGGIGLVNDTERHRLYLALGQKLSRQCAVPGQPHVDDRSLGGMAIYIHEFRRDR